MLQSLGEKRRNGDFYIMIFSFFSRAGRAKGGGGTHFELVDNMGTAGKGVTTRGMCFLDHPIVDKIYVDMAVDT